MPRAWYCASPAMSAMFRMGPAGTRAALRTLITSSLLRPATHVAITFGVEEGVCGARSLDG